MTPMEMRRRLTPEQVAEIRKPVEVNLAALARKFGVTTVAVWKIRHNKTYRPRTMPDSQ